MPSNITMGIEMMKLKKSMHFVIAAAAVGGISLGGGLWSAPAAACGTEDYIATVCIFAGNFAPRGTALAQGQIMSIAQNTALFSLIGTFYGGNGQTTFALPDTRGRVVIGVGQGPGLSSYVEGQTGGTESQTLFAQNVPAHTHTATTTVNVTSTLRGQSAAGNADGPGGNSMASRARGVQYSTSAPNVDMAAGGVVSTATATTTVAPSAGGSQPFSILPPFVVMNYYINLVGIFPSRN